VNSATPAPWSRWEAWPASWTIGVEEEVMLVRPGAWELAQDGDAVLEGISPGMAPHVRAETHAAALELATGVHGRVSEAIIELSRLRGSLSSELAGGGMRMAVAGTHPTARWNETRISAGARYQQLHGSMRELARREPTFALHVHVGVEDPEVAIKVAGRIRAHVPLLLALSANSPFWQGRDTGMASIRVPIFGAFPRTGLPRRFKSYAEWVAAIAPLVDSGVVPEPTFIWWDVRVQPRLGTVELRVMDAQTSLDGVAALVALVQCLVVLEAGVGLASAALVDSPELLEENRFIAARDGMEACLLVPGTRRPVPVTELLREVLDAARPVAEDLGCGPELELIGLLAADPPAERQRRAAAAGGLVGLVEHLSDAAGYVGALR
jgi:carboxylate-amine ligase